MMASCENCKFWIPLPMFQNKIGECLNLNTQAAITSLKTQKPQLVFAKEFLCYNYVQKDEK